MGGGGGRKKVLRARVPGHDLKRCLWVWGRSMGTVSLLVCLGSLRPLSPKSVCPAVAAAEVRVGSRLEASGVTGQQLLAGLWWLHPPPLLRSPSSSAGFEEKGMDVSFLTNPSSLQSSKIKIKPNKSAEVQRPQI